MTGAGDDQASGPAEGSIPASVSAAPGGGSGIGAGAGMAAAEQALGWVRLLAAALLLVGAFACHPDDAHGLGRASVLGLAGAASALLVSLTLLRAHVTRAGRRCTVPGALAAACCDAVIVLAVTCLNGLPPRSLALVLLLLPLWEAALWAGIVGLICMWVGCFVVLGVYIVAVNGPQLSQDVTALFAALPILLLTAIPIALLAEHLVTRTAELDESRQIADDRADLLSRWSEVTAQLFEADPVGVADRLVAGVVGLGASAAAVSAADSSEGPPVAAAGDPYRLAVLTRSGCAEQAALLTWQLLLPGRSAWKLRVDLPGRDDGTARRREAMRLLVAQARVALANAVMLEQLAALRLSDDA